MSATEFGTNDPLTNKAWAKTLEAEGIQETYAQKFMGKEGESALIMQRKELKKGKGDNITVGLSVELEGDGTLNDEVLKGKEESLERHTQSVILHQLRNAVKNIEGMTAQRTPYNLRKIGKNKLKTWFARRTDTVMFNHLCGNTAETNLRYTGGNAVTAPSSARHLIANAAATDEAITSSDKFTLEMIDYAVEKAKTATIADGTGSPISPIMVDGEEMFVAFIHEHQLTDLRITSGGRWRGIYDALLAAASGTKKNPIFTGAAGVYNNTILHSSSRVTQGVHSTAGTAVANTRRAVFCGAGALVMANGGQAVNGGEGSDTTYSWAEETDDYGNQSSCAASRMWGMKKSVYAPTSGTAQDHAAIVMASYAAAHTGA